MRAPQTVRGCCAIVIAAMCVIVLHGTARAVDVEQAEPLDRPIALQPDSAEEPNHDATSPPAPDDHNNAIPPVTPDELDRLIRRMRQSEPVAIRSASTLLETPGETDDAIALQLELLNKLSTLDNPPPALITPLARLASSNEVRLAGQAAQLLVHYDQPQSYRLLLDHAGNAKLEMSRRLAAVRALQLQPRVAVIEGLIRLIEHHDEPLFRAACFEALRQTTGYMHVPQEIEAWRDVLVQLRQHDERIVQQKLLHRAVQQSLEHARHREQLARRMEQLYLRMYALSDEAQRQTLLQEMLGDPLDIARQTALTLIERNLRSANPITEPVRVALRQKLDDPWATIRARAAQLLADLNDKPAAAKAASQLAQENDPAVVAAYMHLLARHPHTQALPRAIELILQQGPAAETVAFLIAAETADLLDADPRQRLIDEARQRLRMQNPPHHPQATQQWARLLIALDGGPATRELILNSFERDDAHAAAAMRAVARSNKPMIHYTQALQHEATRDIFVQALVDRGTQPQLLQYLEAAWQDTEAMTPMREAFMAVVSRLDAQAMLKIDDAWRTDARREHHPWRLTVLRAFALPQTNGTQTNGNSNGHRDDTSEASHQAMQILRLRLAALAHQHQLPELARNALGDIDLTALKQTQQVRQWARLHIALTEDAAWLDRTIAVWSEPEHRPMLVAVAETCARALGELENTEPGQRHAQLMYWLDQLDPAVIDTMSESAQARWAAWQQRMRQPEQESQRQPDGQGEPTRDDPADAKDDSGQPGT